MVINQWTSTHTCINSVAKSGNTKEQTRVYLNDTGLGLQSTLMFVNPCKNGYISPHSMHIFSNLHVLSGMMLITKQEGVLLFKCKKEQGKIWQFDLQ